jgi:hypothetical protein
MRHSRRLAPLWFMADEGGGGGGGGEGEKSWQETFLTGDLKDAPSLKDFKNVEVLAEAFVNTKSALGSSIRIPSADAGAEDWKTFTAKLQDQVPSLVNMPKDDDVDGLNALWSKLGRPATEEGYKLEGEHENSAALITMAKAQGWTNSQLNSYAAQQGTANTEAVEAALKAQNDSRAEVMGEWGSAKEVKQRQIATLLEKTGAPEALISVFNEGNVDGSFLRWADTLVTSMADETSAFGNDGGQGGGGGVPTPVEAKTQIAEILGNKDHAYHNKHDANHMDAVKKFVNLHDFVAGRPASMA